MKTKTTRTNYVVLIVMMHCIVVFTTCVKDMYIITECMLLNNVCSLIL